MMEEVLNWNFDEIELVVVLKSVHFGKYFDKILGDMPPLQKTSHMDENGVEYQNCSKHAFMYRSLYL